MCDIISYRGSLNMDEISTSGNILMVDLK